MIILYDLIQISENDCVSSSEVFFRIEVRTFLRNDHDGLAQDVRSSVMQMFDDSEVVPDMKETGNVRHQVDLFEAFVDGERHGGVPQRLCVQHPRHLVADRDVTVVNQLHRAQEVPAVGIAGLPEGQWSKKRPALFRQRGQDFGAVLGDQPRVASRTVRGRNRDPGIPAKLKQRLVILKK